MGMFKYMPYARHMGTIPVMYRMVRAGLLLVHDESVSVKGTRPSSLNGLGLVKRGCAYLTNPSHGNVCVSPSDVHCGNTNGSYDILL